MKLFLYFTNNNATNVNSDIYATKKRDSSAKFLNQEKGGSYLHFRNVDLCRHSAVYSLP